MVKKVFYIEKEKFLRSMVELALRAKDVEVHTLEKIEGNFYLLDDIKPHLIIFDLEINALDLEKLYSYSTGAKLVATGEEKLKDSLDSRISGFIPKPIVAHNLGERLLSLIE